jgi:CRISPR-associated protein Cas2
MFYLICYDVVSDRRRTQIAHLLEGYGLRVQKSVFESVLTPDQYQMLQTKLLRYLDSSEDQVRFYPLSARNRQSSLILGMQPPRQVDDVAFIV